MKPAIALISLLILTLFSCKSEAEKKAERNAVVDSTIISFEKNLYKTQIDSMFAKEKFNGSIAVFQNGKSIYEKQNGFENFKQKTKLDSNSVFAIGSLSKQFTAVLILQQIENGKLKLDDKASQYLDEFKADSFKNITILQLLNHTSGLNDFGSSPLSKPGDAFNYSNKGYRYLGKIIEKVSGKSYDQNATELFQKAGMKYTSTPSLLKSQDFAGANVGNEKQNSAVENMPKRLANDNISVPAGGILSTVNDLNQWNLALFGGKILKPETLQKMQKQYTIRQHEVFGKVGYGLGIMMNLGKPEAYFHTGYVKGSPSLNIYYPETQTSVIILSNIADESKGKEAFFQPHAEVKKVTDAVETTVVSVRKEMVKEIRK